jgi:hypothetical protein
MKIEDKRYTILYLLSSIFYLQLNEHLLDMWGEEALDMPASVSSDCGAVNSLT